MQKYSFYCREYIYFNQAEYVFLINKIKLLYPILFTFSIQTQHYNYLDLRSKENKMANKKSSISQIQDCFKILKVTQKSEIENQKKKMAYYVPAVAQFKIKGFTKVDFQNLSATVNGVLCINFLIFVEDSSVQKYFCDRLYWNESEIQMLKKNRRKKIERKITNFVPVLFNKDVNVKLPTTRTQQFQIQSFKSSITYSKSGDGKGVKGVRIFHVIRKQFNVEIIKSSSKQQFLAPFNLIDLDLTISLQHMNGDLFQNEKKLSQEKLAQCIPEQFRKPIKVGFNLLRIESTQSDLKTRTTKMLPMLAYSSQNSFGKYDVVESKLDTCSHDEREAMEMLKDQDHRKQIYEDNQPKQLDFKPFKYGIFKIPLYRYPVVDLMTIFIPLWLLSFISIYIFYQTTEIMNRIVNVAALMIAYATIQPIVRENMPDATSLTLVDILIYSQLFGNILFLIRSIKVRYMEDNNPDVYANAHIPTQEQIDLQNYYNNNKNQLYDRWADPLFIITLIISIINFLIVWILIIKYKWDKRNYRLGNMARKAFKIDDEENWTLQLLMKRFFARYKQTLSFDTFPNKADPKK